MDGTTTQFGLGMALGDTSSSEAQSSSESKNFAAQQKPDGLGSSASSGDTSMLPLFPIDPAGAPDGSIDGMLHIVFGTSGNDVLSGTKENDHIFAMEGDDQLDGGDGDDLLAGESGNDSMTGGQGNDVFLLNDGSGHDTITDFTPGEDVMELFAVGVSFDDLTSEHTSEGLLISWGNNSVLLEGVTADPDASWFSFIPDVTDSGEPLMPHIDVSIVEGTNADDTLTGTAEADNIFGNGGDDVLSGGLGNDVLYGGEGSDTLTGGLDADLFVVDAKIGNDVITDFDPAEDMIDMMTIGIAFDDLSASQTSEGLLVSWEGGSLLLENVSEDLDESWFYFLSGDPSGSAAGLPEPEEGGGIMPIFPGFEINVQEGSHENDVLIGGAGNDFIFGFGGNDVLSGNKGYDLLEGGEGDDTLTGGAGQDSFQFGANSGNDTITDFTAGEDILAFSQLGLELSDLTSASKDSGLLISWEGGSVFLAGLSGPAEEAWFSFPVEYPHDAIAMGL